MRNLKKVLCLALVLSMVLAVVSGAAYTNYADDADITTVNENYLIAAQLLQDIKVVVGSKNDEGKIVYDPKGDFDRAAMARVLYVLHSTIAEDEVYNTGVMFETLPTTFTDIDGTWVEGYIKYGQNAGYLNGKSAEIYDPTAPVLAQEMAAALLVVLGYKAEDVAANWPASVVKFGYKAGMGNLFTTGLSSNPVDPNLAGIPVVGLAHGGDAATEAELALAGDLTREEAFYMMFKAIVYRPLVSKVNALGYDADYYRELDINFLEANFGVVFEQEEITDYVAAGKTLSFCGGEYAKDGYVILENAGAVRDFGYTATQKAAGNQGIGFALSATDWDKNIGRKVSGYLTTWGDEVYFSHYAFKYALNKTTVTGPMGSDLKLTKETKVVLDGAKIKIGDTAYELYDSGAHLIINYNKGTFYTAAELVDEINDALTQCAADEIVVKLVDDKIYGIIEIEKTYAQVSKVNDDGTINIDGIVDDEGELVNLTPAIEGLKKDDKILFYIDGRDGKVYGDKAIVKKLVTVVVKNVDGKVSYFEESVDGTALKLADYALVGDATNADYTTATANFVPNDPAYWNLTQVGAYTFEAERVDQFKRESATIKGVVKVADTINNKMTYTFTIKTDSDVAVTYTVKTDIGALDSYVVDTAVTVEYDVKTLEVKGLA
ncbi:MAG: hypothetical protein IKL89_09010 [Clostridia bacterium]|nr:hypothetical protein [Clostridia bacterium]